MSQNLAGRTWAIRLLGSGCFVVPLLRPCLAPTAFSRISPERLSVIDVRLSEPPRRSCKIFIPCSTLEHMYHDEPNCNAMSWGEMIVHTSQ